MLPRTQIVMMEATKKSGFKSVAFPIFVLIFSVGNIIIWHYIVTVHHQDDHVESNTHMTNGLFIDESFRLQRTTSVEQNTAKNNEHDSTTNHPNNQFKNHTVPQDGFAGCLLIKNDNEKLTEWLAYHWLVLPLKYLVVAVDPTGTTSPQQILELWNTTQMGMEIELWHDHTYDHWVDEELDEKHKHRDRQKRFLADCEYHHKKKGRTWLAVIDPDEYITYNLINDDDPKNQRNGDIPQKFLDESYAKEMFGIRKNLGTHFNEHQTVFSFINENKEKEPWISEACHLMPRLFFSAVDSSKDIVAKAHVEKYGLNPLNFSTLRYFHHAQRGRFENNHYGKVIVDLSRIKQSEIKHDMYSVHRPNHKSCLPPTKPYYQALLRVHHYLGSWEQYSSRSDVRRSRERFNKFGSVDYGVDYQLQFWLEAFVEKVGLAKARLLLSSAGKIEQSSVRLMDRVDFMHVQPKIDKLPGKKKELTYFYDEDGSVVHVER